MLLLGRAEVEALLDVDVLIDGSKPGRTSPEQITLYKSVDVAVQDDTAAALVLRGAREHGAGREVELVTRIIGSPPPPLPAARPP